MNTGIICNRQYCSYHHCPFLCFLHYVERPISHTNGMAVRAEMYSLGQCGLQSTTKFELLHWALVKTVQPMWYSISCFRQQITYTGSMLKALKKMSWALHITHSAHSSVGNSAMLIMPAKGHITDRAILLSRENAQMLPVSDIRAQDIQFSFCCFRREMMTSSVSLAAFALALFVAQQGCAEASLMGRGSEHKDKCIFCTFASQFMYTTQ